MTSRYLDTAEAIGRQLTSQAFWHEDRCNWIGAIPHTLPGREHRISGALPFDLFAGTAGVALFLSRLNRLRPNVAYRRTALGAIRQAVSALDRGAPEGSPGLYSGMLGVAYVAAVVGTELDSPDLHDQARTVASRATRTANGWNAIDLISGRAGEIVGCLTLHSLLDAEELLAVAVASGDALIDMTTATRGFRWSPTERESVRSGLAHGAAGAVLAFGELSRATGEVRFRDAESAAIEYEDSFFEPGDRNWRSEEPGSAGAVSRMAWCHGAPGIALSRLRLRRFDGTHDDPDGDVQIGLATTARWVKASVTASAGNFSLCHGVAGNADILALGNPRSTAAQRVADMGIERFLERGEPWLCGEPGSQSVSLMLGLAGIGMFYLRVADPTVPSPLLIVPVAGESGG